MYLTTKEDKNKLVKDDMLPQEDLSKELLYLQRRWQILDSTKQTRFQLSFLLGALLLGVTGFIFTQKLGNSLIFGLGASLFVFILTICGLFLMRQVHKQYEYSCHRIEYMYKQLAMTGAPFDGEQESNAHDPAEKGGDIWRWSYIFILIIGSSCVLSLLISALVKPNT